MTDMTINVALIFSIVSVIGVVSTMWNNHKKTQSDAERRAISIERNFVEITVKLDAVNQTLEAMRLSAESTTKQLSEIKTQLARHDEQIEALQKGSGM